MENTLTATQQSWTTLQKMAFRFFFCFFILYVFPFPFNSVPFGGEINKVNEKILQWYFWIWDGVTTFWHWLIPAIGKNILHSKTPINIFTNGSGDTTYDYVLIFTHLSMAAFVSGVWSVIDRKRKNYAVANYWLCVIVRYYLASMMLSYGFIKVFHAQMLSPFLSRLVQPYGDSSPMGLAWTYVGYSKAFSAILGWSEVVCGLLLFFRKTTLLGALFSLIVMGNVVIINFCFDVPVKLFSSTLELMALYLAAPYFKKLYYFFVLHQPVKLEFYQPVYKNKKVKVLVVALKILFIASALFTEIKGSAEARKKYGDYAPKPPLYGIYNTETFIRNKDTIAPLTTDTTRWKQVIVQGKEYARIKLMNDTMRTYHFKVDTALKTVMVYPRWDTTHQSTLHYFQQHPYLILQGKLNEDDVYIKFKRYDESQFLLINRGFHWINERPFNR